MPIFSVGRGVWVGHIQTSLEQVFCERVDAVSRLTLAYVQQTISQDWHQVIKQVGPDRLGFSIQNFFLLIPQLVHPCLSSRFLLLLEDHLNYFLLIDFRKSLHILFALFNSVQTEAFLFSLFVVSHVVVGSFILKIVSLRILRAQCRSSLCLKRLIQMFEEL